MTAAELATIERRLRAAYADAAAFVQQHDLHADAPARPASPPGRGACGPRITLAALAAAAAVLLIAITAVIVPRSLNVGSQGHHARAANGGPAALLPRYLMVVHTYPWRLDVRNVATGALTADPAVPDGDNWDALAAQGPQTFIASKTELELGPMRSYFYRLAVGSHGQVTSIRRVGPGVDGIVDAAAVTPDGRYVGYMTEIVYGPHGSDSRGEVVLANLPTGKVIASWPVPVSDEIASLSVDGSGNTLAVSAYSYSNPGVGTNAQIAHGDLTQWTSVLRPATSGTPLDRLPRLLPQAGTLALSPNGRILYEFLQVGKISSQPHHDKNPVTFHLAAVSTRTGSVIRVLHTWRAVWGAFIPQLAPGPAGRYLLMAEGASLARVNTTTGQYTELSGTVPEIPPLNLNGKDNPAQGADIDPLAW